MRRLIKFISVLFLIVAAYQTHAITKRHPTMILLHGALFASDIWLPVQTYLQNDGYNVITVDTPGRLHDGVMPKYATLTAAVTKLCKVVDLQPEPVLLVGHNQAGAIITQAIAHSGKNIKGLEYLAAVVPWSGEQPFDLFNDQDNYYLNSEQGHHIPVQLIGLYHGNAFIRGPVKNKDRFLANQEF